MSGTVCAPNKNFLFAYKYQFLYAYRLFICILPEETIYCGVQTPFGLCRWDQQIRLQFKSYVYSYIIMFYERMHVYSSTNNTITYVFKCLNKHVLHLNGKTMTSNCTHSINYEKYYITILFVWECIILKERIYTTKQWKYTCCCICICQT